MVKNIFTFLFIVAFFWLFSYFNWGVFFDHLEKKENTLKQEQFISWELKTFSLEKIRKLEKTEFYYTPSKKVLWNIVHKINKAQKSIFVEAYMLTERKIKFALFNAHKRGINVKIILEHSPYKAIHINKKYFKEYKDYWINIIWSNAQNYTLNHSKIIIIDEKELILSTWNFTYSTFKYNRDLFIFTKDKNIVSDFVEIFNSDFTWSKITKYNNNLVISPNYSRFKIEYLLNSAKKNIKIYIPYLKDQNILDILKKQSKNWIEIDIIMSKKWYLNLFSKKDFNPLNIKIHKINNKYKMHSKAILIDEKYLFIWSVNFSKYALDLNREMWILLKNAEIIKNFIILFNSDK